MYAESAPCAKNEERSAMSVTSYFSKKFVIPFILECYIDLSPYGS